MAVDKTDKNKKNKSSYRVKSHEMVAILMDEWRHHNACGSVSEETALVSKADNRSRGMRTGGKLKCYNCRKQGHEKADCWGPGGEAERKGPKQKGKDTKHKANFTDGQGSFEIAYVANKSDVFTSYS